MLTLFDNFFNNPYDRDFYFFDQYPKRYNKKTIMYRIDENKNLKYEFVLPGYEREEIEVTTDILDKQQVVRVKAKCDKKEYDESYGIIDGYNVEKVTANLKNGILTLTFPPIEKKNTSKVIKIT
jgi:HSP20 family molecular chaperone IbpA